MHCGGINMPYHKKSKMTKKPKAMKMGYGKKKKKKK